MADYPVIHSRERVTNQAECDLRDAVHAVVFDKARDLTFGALGKVRKTFGLKG
jgi:DNA transposition AAA+ family ATPase